RSSGSLSSAGCALVQEIPWRRELETRPGAPLRPLLPSAAARAHAPLEEPSLHGVTRERERGSEVRARNFVPPAAQLELAERREVERIGGEAIAVGDRADRFEPALGTLVLRDGDGAVERDDRGRTNRHQRVVE